MKVIIGSDHLGYAHKEAIKESLFEFSEFEVEDVGCHWESHEPIRMVEYDIYAKEVGRAISTGNADMGILICWSGIGMNQCVSKYPGVRAASCHNITIAQMSRNHNNANVLCMGARFVLEMDAVVMAAYWLKFKFDGGRHQERLERIAKLEVVA